MYVQYVENPDGNLQVGNRPVNESDSNALQQQIRSNDIINNAIANATNQTAQEQDFLVAQELQQQFDNNMNIQPNTQNNAIEQQPNLEGWTTLNEPYVYGLNPMMDAGMNPTQQQQQRQTRLNDIQERLRNGDFNPNVLTPEDTAFIQENSGNLFGF